MADDKLLSDIKKMAYEAGRIALKHWWDNDSALKADKSVLTRADTEISAYLKGQLAGYLQSSDYLLIDEEDSGNEEFFNQQTIESVPYMLVIDPIDGTRGYSNRMPTFGISIGVLKHCRPWLGVVYFPCQGELFFSDGKKSYFVAGAYQDTEKTIPVEPVDQEITQQSVFLGNEAFFTKFNWDFSFCQVMMPSCAVIDLCWPAIGRGCGCFFKANIWDFAGSWPIFESAGLSLRSYVTGKTLESIHTGLFTGQGMRKWKLKEHYILSSERNYPLIKDKITPKA